MATQKARFLLRSGTAALWASVNPVLAAGEPGYETDTGTFKVGDGLTAFTSLPGFALATGVPPNARQIATDNAAGTDGGGDLSANRTIRLFGQALRLHQLTVNGLMVRVDGTTLAARTITGTANQINVANGAGAAGNPTLSLIFPDQPTAEAGSDAVFPMNALRTRQAIDARVPGVSQSWQDVTGSRSSGVIYQNTSGKEIEVKVRTNSVTGAASFEVGATTGTLDVISQTTTGGGTPVVQTNGASVPAGHYYRYTGNIAAWKEKRA